MYKLDQHIVGATVFVNKMCSLYLFWQPDNRKNINRMVFIFEPQHKIFNNVICGTNKGSDQPAHMPSLIRAFTSCLNIL